MELYGYRGTTEQGRSIPPDARSAAYSDATNAWDAASARIFEEAGFRAVATTRAGLSYTAGYPDGEALPREDMVTLVRWITRR
jgi:2-methylisocitrate lyase-like PEP mutase family enzyme